MIILRSEDKVQQAEPELEDGASTLHEEPELPTPTTTPAGTTKSKDKRLSRAGRIWLRFFISVVILALIRAILIRDLDGDFPPPMPMRDMRRRRHGGLDSVLYPEKLEKQFLKVPNNKSAARASRLYDTHPHLAGSSEDLEDAKTVLELFETQFSIPAPEELPIYPAGSPESRSATLNITQLPPGLCRAWIDVYYPILNTPRERSLDILDEDGSSLWSADLVEDGNPLDPEAAKYWDAVPTFHGLSQDGEAEGELVYANYGTKEDYDKLVADGIDLEGKIVIVRYGAIFRGLKIKGAQELGAAGVLIYSDPRDDGAVTVENGYLPYPDGPARNPTSVQRGSVQFISIYPGDPSTPGYPAYKNATRVTGTNKPSIPSLPISWENAERLLEEIRNVHRDRPLTGQSSFRKIKLVNHVHDKVTPIWNTMAVIPGHLRDEVVVIGNHRDAWVMGAADPSSGTVSFHEVVRGFGALLRSGWQPVRTILFANWDAEEYGLVGSTEWGEDFPEFVSSNVVAYINIDVSVSGSRWQVSSSPSLAHLIRDAAQEVPHPTHSGRTLWDALEDDGPYDGDIDPDIWSLYANTVSGQDTSLSKAIAPLGSGSDYTVFLQHLGVASMDQGFGYTLRDAVYHYHSIYDSERWKEVYGDPGAHRQVAVAKHLGLVALRLANSIVLPLNTTHYSLELESYLDKVEALPFAKSSGLRYPHLRQSIKELQFASQRLDQEKHEAGAELRKRFTRMHERWQNATAECKPARKPWEKLQKGFRKLLGFLNLSDENPDCRPHPHQRPFHIDFFRDEDEDSKDAKERKKHSKRHKHKHKPSRGVIRAAKRVRKANQKLVGFERGFISKKGIKDREWYKHLGVAPGKWLGYGATTFPALTEALEIEKDADLGWREAKRLQRLIDKIAQNLDA